MGNILSSSGRRGWAMSTFAVVWMLAAVVAGCGNSQEASSSSTPGDSGAPTLPEVREIAKEAYIYGFPMVDNYRLQYSHFVTQASPEFKGPWNQVHSTDRLLTPADSDVPFADCDMLPSTLGAYLGAEPLVLDFPLVDSGRYYSAQFVDGYTNNFAYLGTRTTGNAGGTYLLAGPNWNGDKPRGIDRVIRSDTDFVTVLYRTQLFDPADVDNVKNIQAGYRVRQLSAYLQQPAPPAPPPVSFRSPLSLEDEKTNPYFFNLMNFVLQYAPTLPSEEALRARFARIGVSANGTFDSVFLTPEVRTAIKNGMADAWSEYESLKKEKIDSGRLADTELHGTREMFGTNYLYRMAGAVLGIYGDSRGEMLNYRFDRDTADSGLTGAQKYFIHFRPDQLPPVNAFWSLTMYDAPAGQLVANPIDRNVVGSAMAPSITKDPDGGLTIYLQQESPGPTLESNWLPAPDGPFSLILRLYWPNDQALDGLWKAPEPERL